MRDAQSRIFRTVAAVPVAILVFVGVTVVLQYLFGVLVLARFLPLNGVSFPLVILSDSAGLLAAAALCGRAFAGYSRLVVGVVFLVLCGVLMLDAAGAMVWRGVSWHRVATLLHFAITCGVVWSVFLRGGAVYGAALHKGQHIQRPVP